MEQSSIATPIVAWIEDEQAATALAKRRRNVSFMAPFAIIYGAFFVFIAAMEFRSGPSFRAFATLLQGVCWLIWSRSAAFNRAPTFPLAVTLDADGIVVEFRGSVSLARREAKRYSWSNVLSVDLNAEALVFNLSGFSGALIVPRTALTTKADAAISLIYDRLVDTKNLIATPRERIAVISNTRRPGSNWPTLIGPF